MNVLKAYLIETSELEEKFNMGKTFKRFGKSLNKGMRNIKYRIGMRKQPSILSRVAKGAGKALAGAGAVGAGVAAFHKPTRDKIKTAAKEAKRDVTVGWRTDPNDRKRFAGEHKDMKTKPSLASKTGEVAGSIRDTGKSIFNNLKNKVSRKQTP